MAIKFLHYIIHADPFYFYYAYLPYQANRLCTSEFTFSSQNQETFHFIIGTVSPAIRFSTNRPQKGLQRGLLER